MMMIKRIKPKPPLGKYPQPVLYGHVGRAPTRSKIKMITRIVPIIHPSFVLEVRFDSQ